MRLVYSFIFYLVLPFILLRLLWKARHLPAYHRGWPERLGWVEPQQTSGIWIHAVSVGETLAAIELVKKLQQEFPSLPIVFTTMTPTGSKQAHSALGASVVHSYVPYDCPTAVKRFLHRCKPSLLIIMETELWPNILYYTARAGIPIVLANARLSVKSHRGYQCLRFFIKHSLKKIDCIAAQTQDDAERFKALGASAGQISIIGNIKFDLHLPQDLIREGRLLRSSWDEREVWISASTHVGEEERILAAHAELKKSFPNALLILVPRHPERFQEVAELCMKKGFNIVKRSAGIPCHLQTDVFLGDTMGELFLYYAASDVAFVGGSLTAIGGHNMLEPAALNLPVITGAHCFNFTEIVRLLKDAQALTVVNNENELVQALLRLFDDKNDSRDRGRKAAEVVAANRGALDKQFAIISQLLRSRLH